MRRLFIMLALLPFALPAFEFDRPPHSYWQRQPRDRFTRMMEEVAAGKLSLDTSEEKAFVSSILRALEIDASSQLLVYSATSLQSERINPRNPRGLYFNEDTYVGFVPDGRVEIASFDPEAGMVFTIFDRLASRSLPRHVRSDRCMNCHVDAPTSRVPGLFVQSVAVTWDGSSQETYRYDEMGHAVPLGVRFGGWHLTGKHGLKTTHANLIGELSPAGLKTVANPPGLNFDLGRYPRATSDILVHLVHEHQIGFINRVIQAIYLDRENTTMEKREAFAREFTFYILFQGEASLPPGGISGDLDYQRDFRARDPVSGPSLRDFDLSTRMFKYRCSFMIQSPVWSAVPSAFRRLVLIYLNQALSEQETAVKKTTLSMDEKRMIRVILQRSFPEFPRSAEDLGVIETKTNPSRKAQNP